MIPIAPLSLLLTPAGRPQLKELRDQVVVILGASSGIGRESALQFAAKGAKVVVAARSEPGLVSLVKEIEAAGGEAAYAVCDVTDVEQVTEVADTAIQRFGRIDTWVNVAAVGVYAKFEEIPLDEFRRVIDVNLMGYVHGARAALPHLRREGRGALIFVSSVESTFAMPLQSPYTISKHAVQGLAEVIRRELQADGVPISVTSIKPGVINTPFYDNARSHLGFKPTAPPPAYHPSVVAETILYAAEHPVRDLYPGGAGRGAALLQLATPGMADAFLSRFGHLLQRMSKPAGDDALYEPRSHDNRIKSDVRFPTVPISPVTWLQMQPKVKAAAGLVAAGFIGRAIGRRSGRT